MDPSETNNSDRQSQPENFSRPQQSYPDGNQVTPNSSAVLILGILSIVFCWCYGLFSVIMGIVALVLASAGEKEYNLNPQWYSISSYKNLKAGKTCAIIGLCLAGLSLVSVIIYIILFGTLAFSFFNLGLQN